MVLYVTAKNRLAFGGAVVGPARKYRESLAHNRIKNLPHHTRYRGKTTIKTRRLKAEML